MEVAFQLFQNGNFDLKQNILSFFCSFVFRQVYKFFDDSPIVSFLLLLLLLLAEIGTETNLLGTRKNLLKV
jgi:hypothetical protein